MSFLDHLAAADAAIGAHVCTPGAVRPTTGDPLDPVPVAIEQPIAGDVIERGRFARARPVAWLPVAEVPDLRLGWTVEGEGFAWKVAAAPTRPGDGRWWRAEVDKVGSLG